MSLTSSRWSFLLLVTSLAGCGGADDTRAPAAGVSSGRVLAWPEATRHLNVDLDSGAPIVSLGEARASGIDALWSIASTAKSGPSGFFYADVFRPEQETKVARVSAQSVDAIRDASTLDYRNESVGPVRIGDIVVVHHSRSKRYLALVLDEIRAADPRTAGAGPYAFADVTWFLTSEGSADFSRAAATTTR